MSDPRIAEAVALLQAGNLSAAESLCLAIIAAGGLGDPAPHALLGRVQASAGRLQDARRAVDTALRIDPDHRLSLLEDAELARRERDPLRAERSLRRLLQLEPDNPRFWANLAGLLLGLGRPAQAREAAASALGRDPQRPELLMLMADTEHAAGDHASAMARWRALSTTHPQLARVWVGLGRAAERLGDERLASLAFTGALDRDPRHPDALRGLARACLSSQDRAGALSANQRLLEVQPDAVDAWYAIALAHWQEHDLAPAMTALHEVLRRDRQHLPARWAVANLPPDTMHADEAAMQAYVERYLLSLAAFDALGDPPAADHPAVLAAVSMCNNFYVHYAVADSLAIQRRSGALLTRLVHAVSGRAQLPPRPARARARVLFVSSFLYQHSVGKLFERVITGLDREHLDIRILSCGTTQDALTARLAAFADGFGVCRRDINGLRQRIIDEAPDVLVWLDLGMDPMLGWVAAQRLAPVQCVLWGHPVTTGLDNIDWFLTAEAMERAGGEADYSEQVFRLPGLGCRFAPPQDSPAPRSADSAMPPVFAMPQTVFKLTPVHDGVLAQIAAAIPDARFELVPGSSEGARGRLRQRIAAGFAAAGASAERVLMIHPPLEPAQWFELLGRFDVNLDPIGWSGGVTSLEMLWYGIPTLTLPGRSMRSRHTLAMLRLLQVDDRLVATDIDDYVAKAVALGRSPRLRAELRGVITERRHRLYDDPQVSAALQGFLIAVAAGRDPRIQH